jgi:hypothetical protein
VNCPGSTFTSSLPTLGFSAMINVFGMRVGRVAV